MSFRKYNKPNPFEAAKRNINLKLYEIQEQIINKFGQGQRELMRRTIRQLLENEGTTENKIKILLSMVDSYQYNIGTTLDKSLSDKCSTIEYYSNQLQERQYDNYRSSQDRCSPHRSTSNKLIQSFQNKRFYTENEQSKNSDVQYMSSSHKTPYSTLQNHRNSPLNLQYTQKQSNGNQQIENNIFSFRTQNQNVSPGNKESKKASIKRLQNNLKQTPKNDENQQRHKKKYNVYDGNSQMYSYLSAQKPNLANSLQLYKKISNRLRYSPCIIGKVFHQTSSSSALNLQSRYKLQQQNRQALKKMLLASLSK